MNKILLLIALLAGLASCKKENDDYVDLKDQVLFTQSWKSPISNFRYKYRMLSGAQRRVIDGQEEFYRTPYNVYTDKKFELNTYYKAPLDKSDSLDNWM